MSTDINNLVSFFNLLASTCIRLQTVTNKRSPCSGNFVSDTRKFDRGLKAILHDELHWLDVPERIEYKLGVMVYPCLHGQAPCYLADHLIPASDAAPRRGRLRSANRNFSLCLAVDSAHTAVGLSTMPARQSGTRCLMNLEILTVLIVLNGS